jgi:hypothetical protein
MLKKSELFVVVLVISFEIVIAQTSTNTELIFFISKGRYSLRQIIDTANIKGVRVSFQSNTRLTDS